jgi:hypothetical protein
MTERQPAWFDPLVARARERARARAGKLRTRHPRETARQLGERLVASSANRAGLIGAATGTLALFALPLGLPAGVAAALLLEAELLLALLALYDLDSDADGANLRLYALWAGAGFADVAKSAGLKLGADALGRTLRGSLPARIIARLDPALVRAILRRIGLGWLPRALKLWPVLGAPVAFAMDRAALRALGFVALSSLDGAVRPRSPRRPARSEGATSRRGRRGAARRR